MTSNSGGLELADDRAAAGRRLPYPAAAELLELAGCDQRTGSAGRGFVEVVAADAKRGALRRAPGAGFTRAARARFRRRRDRSGFACVLGKL